MDRNGRAALIVFVSVELAALPLILVLAHYRWFFYDEWDFLAGRTGGDLGDLFRAHNEHWSTLPILAYRALWWLFGLRTYVPYQALAVALHLTAAALLRVVMRRAGVGPWIATVVASLFALLGAGDENIVWAFQMAWGASLVFGLTHLLLADHDGPVDRRDALGLAAGVAGLMCSGVAVTMVVVVGLATFLRRGWRVAAVHTAPLAVLYLVWWAATGRDTYDRPAPSVPELARFVTTGIGNAFEELGQVPFFGILLAVVLLVGLVLAWGPLTSDERRRRAGAPAALLAGALVFLVIGGLGRAATFGSELARSGRYVHVVAALTLPTLAVAADALTRRWRLVTPAVLALFVIAAAGNLAEFEGRADEPPATSFAGEAFQRGTRNFMLWTADVARTRSVPPRVRPDLTLAEDVTVGWLLDGAASNRIPEPDRDSATGRANATLALALRQSRAKALSAPCVRLRAPATHRLEAGESIGFGGGVLIVAYVPEDGRASRPRAFDPSKGRRLEAISGPLTLRLSPGPDARSVELCG